ncbi:MAG: hypothetical protein WAL63_06870 [Solirubrobacteraceae bacterium]
MSDSPGIRRSADDGAVGARVPARTAQARSGRRLRREESSPHASRFRIVTAVLVGLGVGALVIAGAIAVAGRSSSASTSSQPWSQWSPSTGGTLGAREIATYVAPLYRISAVNQLAVVTVVNLESASAAAAAQSTAANGTTTGTSTSGLQVAVRPSPTSSAVSLLSGTTIAYNLCGIGGRNCAIGVGQPSGNRLLLLRREALELALYTFKYIHGTQNVVAILPPGHTVQTSTSRLSKSLPTSDAASSTKPVDVAVLFVAPELQPLLHRPLLDTLPEPTPPTVAEMARTPEAGLVDQVTARGLFSEQLQQAQDGSDLIVLDPLPPQ